LDTFSNVELVYKIAATQLYLLSLKKNSFLSRKLCC